MSQSHKRNAIAVGLVSMLWALSLAGCSASQPESAALKRTELTFDINKCQQMGAGGLYKCPAMDKPICSPDYTGSEVECLKINKSGTVIVQQMQME